MIVSTVGSKSQKDKLNKEFDKHYNDFMYIYDPETSIGQGWYGIVADLISNGSYNLSADEAETFAEALNNFSAMIGDEFDLDLEYNQ